MLEKLSGDAVEPEQLAQLHGIGLSQPLRPAQRPGGAEVEWWKLGSMVLGAGRACIVASICFEGSVYAEWAKSRVSIADSTFCVSDFHNLNATKRTGARRRFF